MIIYQPAVFQAHPDKFNRLAIELAEALVFPKWKLLSSHSDADSVHLLLQTSSALLAFEVYSKKVGEEIFEGVLRLGAFLEAKRKEQNIPALKDISIYILAEDFSREFLDRIPSSLIGICLFKWHLLRADMQEAVMVHEMKRGIGQNKGAVNSIEENLAGDDLQIQPFHQELSTREFIALSRLGMELRSQRSPLKGRLIGDKNPCGASPSSL